MAGGLRRSPASPATGRRRLFLPVRVVVGQAEAAACRRFPSPPLTEERLASLQRAPSRPVLQKRRGRTATCPAAAGGGDRPSSLCVAGGSCASLAMVDGSLLPRLERLA